jgi:hypothetical protein
MGSLVTCIAKAGEAFSAEDRAELLLLAQQFRKGGMKSKEADLAAVGAYTERMAQRLSEAEETFKAGRVRVEPVAAPNPAAPSPALQAMTERQRNDWDNEVAQRLDLEIGGAGLMRAVGNLHEVQVEVLSAPGEPLRAEVKAMVFGQGGRPMDARVAEGEPAIRAVVDDFASKIQSGVDRMVQRVVAERRGMSAPDAPALPAGAATDAQIRERLQAKIAGDFDAAVREYAARPDAQGGKVLNTDTARELSPDYLADRTRSAAVHEPASQFVKDLYARMLAEPPKEGEIPLVMFTAGGIGAGKSSAVKMLPQVQGLADQAQIIYDTNMNGYASSKQKVEQALAAGKDVVITLVARDPEDALVNGALPRAERQRQEFGTGRTVPIGEHIKTHVGAIDTVKRLAEEYADDPRVAIRVIDNSLGKGKAQERPLTWLADLAYNDVERRVRAALESQRAAGTISAETYRGFAGDAQAGGAAAAADAGAGAPAGRLQAEDRPGVRPGSQQEPSGRVAAPGIAGFDARLSDISRQFPDLAVQLDGMERPMPLAEFMATVRAEADELAADAPLVQVAAECALVNGL